MNSTLLAADNLVSHPLNYAGRQLTVFNFAADRLINTSLVADGVWEPWQLNLMSKILREDFVCVDIGANIGINAMFMASCCPKGRVIAYEPFDAIYQVLCKNIEANGLTNVTAINKGISDEAKTLHMVTDVSLVGGAHVAQTEALVSGEAGGSFQFDRLDSELRRLEISRVDFMKIDVEGHEPEALAGAVGALSNPGLQLFIEFNPAQLRRAGSADCAFPDKNVLTVLKDRFRHVFYMRRDNTLSEVRDYHALRRMFLGGYFVDDLYCTNEVPPEAAGLIVGGPAVPPYVLGGEEVVGEVRIATANRDLDGWALGGAYHPPTMSLTLTGQPGDRVLLKFDAIHTKHLHQSGYPSWPVWVLAGDQMHTVDLLDRAANLTVQLGQGPLDVTLQSEHQSPAAIYLGNPTDTRHVGFRVTFEKP